MDANQPWDFVYDILLKKLSDKKFTLIRKEPNITIKERF